VGRKKLGFVYFLTGLPPKLITQLDRIRRNFGISRAEVIRQGTQQRADEIEKEKPNKMNSYGKIMDDP
jgi:metal-responsive CopG/Arc/MetJ family transcriptional regulator